MKCSKIKLFAAALLIGQGALHAASIGVPNFSFESQSGLGQPQGVNISVDNWQKAAEPGYWAAFQAGTGVFWIQTAGVFYDNPPTSGLPYGNLNGNQGGYILSFPGVSLSQDLTSPDAKFTAGMSYNLKVGVFGKNMTDGNTLQLSLYYRDGGNNMLTVGSPTTITYSAAGFPNSGQLNFIDFQVDVPTVQGTDAWADQFIGINIQSVNGDFNFGNWDLDNVRLSATPVPEPGTLSLMGLGLGGLFLARIRSTRRNRRLSI